MGVAGRVPVCKGGARMINSGISSFGHTVGMKLLLAWSPSKGQSRFDGTYILASTMNKLSSVVYIEAMYNICPTFDKFAYPPHGMHSTSKLLFEPVACGYHLPIDTGI